MMIGFTYTVLLSIAIVKSQDPKTVFLTPSITNTNGAFVLTHINEVNTIDNTWAVDTKLQENWQFIIYLQNSFGFHANMYSAIKFTINSPFIPTDTTTNNDLVFGFTANNEQYLSMLIPIDNNGRTNKMYPSCNNNEIHSFSPAFGDISVLPHLDRTCDIAGGSCTNWRDMLPPNIPIQPNNFPISILLENNPITNTLDLSLNTATFSTGFIQKCTFNAFPTDIGLKIYIAANDPTQSFVINSFKIESWTETANGSPTDVPPTLPPNIPFISPTNNPAASPIDIPITSSSNNPSFCCIAEVIPFWNGWCWSATDAQSCFDIRSENGRRCHWDPNNCRAEQNCLFRKEKCRSGSQCCSKICRFDTRECM